MIMEKSHKIWWFCLFGPLARSVFNIEWSRTTLIWTKTRSKSHGQGIFTRPRLPMPDFQPSGCRPKPYLTQFGWVNLVGSSFVVIPNFHNTWMLLFNTNYHYFSNKCDNLCRPIAVCWCDQQLTLFVQLA